MRDGPLVQDVRNAPLDMAHKIRALSNKSKRNSKSARMVAELKPIHGATAFEDEYIIDGYCIEVNRALDEQVVHSSCIVEID